ncbi:MAG TPA: hypothetical protein VL625_07960 [Patescibacteria group bacterium]|jgi:hypothetical protein|nr:hypothetical protein [Patescibacteria group bacterium]
MLIDIFQDRATVRTQKISSLKERLVTQKADARRYRREAEALDAQGYANFYFMWDIDRESEEPIREMERIYIDRLPPEERKDFVRRREELGRAWDKAAYRAEKAADSIRDIKSELSRLQWQSRKEAAKGLLDRVFHWH